MWQEIMLLNLTCSIGIHYSLMIILLVNIHLSCNHTKNIPENHKTILPCLNVLRLRAHSVICILCKGESAKCLIWFPYFVRFWCCSSPYAILKNTKRGEWLLDVDIPQYLFCDALSESYGAITSSWLELCSAYMETSHQHNGLIWYSNRFVFFLLQPSRIPTVSSTCHHGHHHHCPLPLPIIIIIIIIINAIKIIIIIANAITIIIYLQNSAF